MDTDSDVSFCFTVEETVRTIMKDAHLFFHTATEPCDTGVRPGTVNHEDAATTLFIVQELCESGGGLLVSVDVKIYWTVLRHWSQLVPNMSADIWGH